MSQIAFGGRRRRVYRRIVSLAGVRPGDAVLDVGCSGGYLARKLADAAGPSGRVTGVDPSQAAITYARRRATGAMTFTVGVAQDLPLPDASFDAVTCTLAMHHVPARQRAAAFRDMYRVTKSGGRLLVADFDTAGRPLPLHAGGRRMRRAAARLPSARWRNSPPRPATRSSQQGACPCCATSWPSARNAGKRSAHRHREPARS